MDFSQRIQELLSGLASPDGLLDKPLLVRDLVVLVAEEVINLQKKNAALVKEMGELREQIEGCAPREKFVEWYGVLLKKKVRRRNAECCYCPKCGSEMGKWEKLLEPFVAPFVCSCGYKPPTYGMYVHPREEDDD